MAPAATFQQTPAATLPASRPSLFDQALTEIRAPASPVPVRQEPLVLAMEEPEFLKLVPKPEAAPIEPNEEEENDDEDESEESTEEAETPLAVEAVESEVSREEPQSEAQQTPEILTVETEVSPAKEDTQKKVKMDFTFRYSYFSIGSNRPKNCQSELKPEDKQKFLSFR